MTQINFNTKFAKFFLNTNCFKVTQRRKLNEDNKIFHNLLKFWLKNGYSKINFQLNSNVRAKIL